MQAYGMNKAFLVALFLLLGFVGKLDLDSAARTAAIEEEVRLEAASAAGAALAALYGDVLPLTNPLDCDARMSHRGVGAERWVTTPCYVRGSRK